MKRWDFMFVVPRDEEERANNVMVELENENKIFEYKSDHDYEGVTRFFFKGDIYEAHMAFSRSKLTVLN